MPTWRLGQTSDASWLAETKNEYQLSEDFLNEDAEEKNSCECRKCVCKSRKYPQRVFFQGGFENEFWNF